MNSLQSDLHELAPGDEMASGALKMAEHVGPCSSGARIGSRGEGRQAASGDLGLSPWTSWPALELSWVLPGRTCSPGSAAEAPGL